MQDNNGPNSSNTAYICNRVTNPNKKKKKQVGSDRIGSRRRSNIL